MHVVISILGRTIHPCWVIVVFNVSYFSSFLVMASCEYIIIVVVIVWIVWHLVIATSLLFISRFICV